MKRVFQLLTFIAVVLCLHACQAKVQSQPNILFIISDDQSWEHVGCYGDQAVRTPAMDQLAREGVLFKNAYCAAPSCSPSRAGILSGQDIYRLEEGGVLTGFIKEKFTLFPELLEESGYHIGFTGKGYWPKTADVNGAIAEPIGRNYGKYTYTTTPKGISRNNYTANLADFLRQVPENEPFFFWLGFSEPHIPYETDRGLKTGIDTSKIRVPSFLPDLPLTRLNLADYLSEIEWADQMLDSVMQLLEKYQLMENTLIVFTSDNGMPFPRSKSTLYNHGVHMPLICKWEEKIDGGRVVDDPLSLIDLAPTFLDLAGLEIPDQMTGKSISKLLFSGQSGIIEPERDFVATAFEKHTSCREGQLGFPRRAIHTIEWTYIRNFEPERWPMGDPNVYIEDWGFYGECDPGRLKHHMLDHRSDTEMQAFFNVCFGKVLPEELYRIKKDPDMLNNLASDPAYEDIVGELRIKLLNYLRETKDPRMTGLSPWDKYYFDKPVGKLLILD